MTDLTKHSKDENQNNETILSLAENMACIQIISETTLNLTDKSEVNIEDLQESLKLVNYVAGHELNKLHKTHENVFNSAVDSASREILAQVLQHQK